MNQSITKKFRPKKFSQVVGQRASTSRIVAAIEKGVLPPAYLFPGVRGCGKTTTARLVAMSLNCSNREGVEPCGTCVDCQDIINDRSNYLIELDGASKGGIDNVRSLQDSLRYIVPDGHYKIVVIDEAHGLSTQAWNATLKIIEEPPKNVLFIFCTTEIQKVIGTVKSRCVSIQFPGVNDDVIKNNIKEICASENVDIEDKAIDLIAKEAFGSIRDAQSILEGFIRMGSITAETVKTVYQTIDPTTVITYFNNILSKDIKQASNMAKGWMRMGVGPENIITALLEHVRNMIMDFKVEDKTVKGLLKSQRQKIGDAQVVSWISFFYDQLKFVREYPMEYSLVLDLITIRLIDSLSKKSTTKSTRTSSKNESPKTELKESETPNSPNIPSHEEVSVEVINDIPLDKEKVFSLQRACEGIIIETLPNFKRMTLRNGKGTVFDIVSTPDYVKSNYYILGSDLDNVINNYPEGMNTFIKINT